MAPLLQRPEPEARGPGSAGVGERGAGRTHPGVASAGSARLSAPRARGCLTRAGARLPQADPDAPAAAGADWSGAGVRRSRRAGLPGAAHPGRGRTAGVAHRAGASRDRAGPAGLAAPRREPCRREYQLFSRWAGALSPRRTCRWRPVAVGSEIRPRRTGACPCGRRSGGRAGAVPPGDRRPAVDEPQRPIRSLPCLPTGAVSVWRGCG
jgi:hypothetical protein